MTYASTTSAKSFNILARQISCNAEWKWDTLDYDNKLISPLIELLQTALSTLQEPVAQCRVTTSKEANYWFPSSTLTVSEQREDIAEYYGRSHHPRLQTHSRWLQIQVLLLRPLPVQTVTYTFQISGKNLSTVSNKIYFIKINQPWWNPRPTNSSHHPWILFYVMWSQHWCRWWNSFISSSK